MFIVSLDRRSILNADNAVKIYVDDNCIFPEKQKGVSKWKNFTA